MLLVLQLALFLLFCPVVDCLHGSTFWKIKQLVEQDRHQRYLTLLQGSSLPKGGYLMQPLDHFDASDQRQYKQRYWVEQKFWKKPNGPVLLYIGGESSLIPEVIAGGKSGGGRGQ